MAGLTRLALAGALPLIAAPEARAEKAYWHYYWKDIVGSCPEDCFNLVYKCPCKVYRLDLP